MQGTRIRLLLGGLLLASAFSNVQAEALQPDPAWQQGKLDNGFTWQLLTTPQRPNDRIELRLLVRTGSLAENPQQQGFAHFLPRLALIRSEGFTTAQLQSFWQQAIDNQRPMSPAITSYDFTSYNLSLPNGRPDLLKAALNWLVDTGGKMVITQDSVHAAYQAPQEAIQPALKRLANELVKVRDNGLSQAEFDTLIAQKKDQLGQLFATYARTDTGVLMSQRLRSQQNAVVDIAPEQYQKLRQTFLTTLTLPDFNQELKQQLSHDPSLLLLQPKGESELNVKTLQESYDSIVVPSNAPTDTPQTSDSTTAATPTGAGAAGTAQ